MILDEPPSGIAVTMAVGACALVHDGRLLLLKRAPDKTYGRTWGLPGGKADGEEPLLATAARETAEETSILVDRTALRFLQLLYVVPDHRPDFCCRFELFGQRLAYRPPVRLRRAEHLRYRWQPLDRLDRLPHFADGLASLRRALPLLRQL